MCHRPISWLTSNTWAWAEAGVAASKTGFGGVSPESLSSS